MSDSPAERITPVARKLMVAIFKVATVCALLTCLIQGLLSWRHARQEFALALAEVSQMHVPLLSISIWDIEPTAIRQQLATLAERREIGAVRLTTKTGQIFEYGTLAHLQSGDAYGFDILQPGGQMLIGRLEVAGNPQALAQELVYAVGTSVVGYGILTMVICALVQMVLRRELEQPLRRVADFAGALDPSRLTEPLDLAREPGHQRDEIDLVVDGFGKLQLALSAHFTSLDSMVAARTRDLETALAEIHKLSTIDPLTDCYNRRSFDQIVAQELARAERHDRPLSVIFCDIDHFKCVNDTRGHGEGDQALQAFSALLRGKVRRDIDSVTRYGGEEFVILLPEADLTGALNNAQRICEAVAATPVVTESGPISITASFGVTQWRPGESISQLLMRADKALYKAKLSGRNRVCSTQDDSADSA